MFLPSAQAWHNYVAENWQKSDAFSADLCVKTKGNNSVNSYAKVMSDQTCSVHTPQNNLCPKFGCHVACSILMLFAPVTDHGSLFCS